MFFTFGQVMSDLFKSAAKTLFQDLFCRHSYKMLIQLTVVQFVLLCQQKDRYVFSGCRSELFLAVLTSDSVPSSFFFLTANENPVFDKLLSLPVGTPCVQSGLYGDKIGTSVHVCGSCHMWERDKRSDKWETGETAQKRRRRRMKLMACFQTSGTTERCSVGLCVQMSGPGLLIACLIKPFTMSLSFCLVGLRVFVYFRYMAHFLTFPVFFFSLFLTLSFNMLASTAIAVEIP